MRPVIIDSDIGDDITDTTAIIFALKSPELDIKALLSNNNHEKQRALILDKLVELAGKQIPVFQGVEGANGALRAQKEFIEGYRGEVRKLEENVGVVEKWLQRGALYLSDGTLTNVAYLLDRIPGTIKNTEFHVMAGAINRDYDGKNKPVSEWNIQCDVPSARSFFAASLSVNLYPLDCSWDLEISDEQVEKIIKNPGPLNRALKEQFSTWREAHNRNLVEYDSLLVAAVIRPELITEWKEMKLKVNNHGQTIQDSAGSTVRVALDADREEFTRFFMARMQKSISDSGELIENTSD